MDFEATIKLFSVVLYGLGVLLLIILSAFAVSLIAKYAEKPALAAVVSVVYIGLEIIILTTGAVTLGFLN